MGERLASGPTRSARAGAAVVAVLLLMALGAGPARAGIILPSCDTSWTGTDSDVWFDASNWTHGVPTSTTSACIQKAGTYTVEISSSAEVNLSETAQAKSLQLGGSSGTQTLELIGQDDQNTALLELANGGLVGSNGAILLTSGCVGPACNAGPATLDTDTTGASPLENDGTITSDPGSHHGSLSHAINGNLTNVGTIDVNAPLQYGEGALENLGTIDIAQNQSLTVPLNAVTHATVSNDSPGLITNTGGNGFLSVGPENTFQQSGGTTSPHSANPASPVVFVDGSDVGVGLDYIGSGASTIAAQGEVALTGNLGLAQNLVVEDSNDSGCVRGVATAAGSFTNAGTITLAGSCGSSLRMSSGMLTNSGTLLAMATPGSSVTRELKGRLTNSGRLHIDGPTAFDGSGDSLTQTGGTTALASGQILDMTGSAGLRLKGGLLEGGGHTPAQQAIINGSVDNTGGNVVPGSVISPGLMALDGHYTQGSGGRLTAVIAGKTVGSGYSQLGVVGGSTLGGTLAIISRSGQPSAGRHYTILGGSAVSGKFSKLLGQFLPESSFPPGWTVGYKPQYGAKQVTLVARPAAGLRVRRAGSGSGTVTSSPAGIDCGTKCDAPFFQTKTVTLTAHPGSGSAFAGWSGACTGKKPTCQVKMSQARVVTAKFS